MEEVGAVGLEAFLLSVLPLLPRPSGHDRRPGRTSDERVVELARALAGCASDRARVHFQASQYFQENRVLVRRLKALEGMLRTRELSRGAQISLADEETETAMHRYLPRRGGG